MAKALARQPHRGGVDQRHDLVDVVTHHAEKQCLVAVVQGTQGNKLLQCIRQLAHVLQKARHLLVLRVDVRRQQAAQTQRVLEDPL